MTADNTYGIYIHIPFCLQKCRYCDFYSLPSLELCRKYVDAIKRNIKLTAGKVGRLKIDTVFFGGGTPSCIDAGYISEILYQIASSFELLDGCEISIECNPSTIDENKLKIYKESGINRLSFGMQSANDSELKILGRIHNFEGFRESYMLARQNKFDNINVDVMIGIPEQSISSVRATLDSLLDLSPEHISVYMLSLEKGTPFYRNRDKLRFPDENTVSDMYMLTDEILTSASYEHYEISNFCKKGYECRHNMRYWEQGMYLSFGTAAHSYYNSCRYAYKRDIEGYIRSEDFSDMIEQKEELSDSDRREESLMLAFRLSKGADESLIRKSQSKEILQKYIKSGYVLKNGDRYSLTPPGMLMSNYIISDILLAEEE